MDRITDRRPTHQNYSDHTEAHQGDSDQTDTPKRNNYMRNGYRKNGYQAKKRVATKRHEEVEKACGALLRLLELDPLSTEHLHLTPSLATHPTMPIG